MALATIRADREPIAGLAEPGRQRMRGPLRWLGEACLITAAVTMACALAFSPPARANTLSFDDSDGLHRRTIAHTQRLRDYDNAKKYGAETMQDRPRRPWEPDGWRFGNFLVFPTLGVAIESDDNIYWSQRHRESDLRTDINPVIKLQSRFPRHRMKVVLGARSVNHLRYKNLDFVEGFGHLETSFHFDHAHTISIALTSNFLHEDRADPVAPENARTRVPSWYNRAVIGITRDVGRLYGTFSLRLEDNDYFDVIAFDGSTIDQDIRDIRRLTNELSLGYRISPGYEWLAKVRLIRQWTLGTGTFNRNGTGYEALSGLAFELNPLIRMRVLGGYGAITYDHAGYDPTASWLIEAQATWLATQRMTIYTTINRAYADAIATDGSAFINTNIIGRLEYEVWRNLIVNATAEYHQTDFVGLERIDQSWSATLGVDYLHTKNWKFDAKIKYDYRYSPTDPQFATSRTRIRVGAKLRF
ncbi:MAG: outer membrane beta-barrel protein [Pseudomonadota bacterium]